MRSERSPCTAHMQARLGQLLHPGPETGIGRAVRAKDVVHIPDATANPAWRQGDPMRVEAVDVGGARTARRADAQGDRRLWDFCHGPHLLRNGPTTNLFLLLSPVADKWGVS